MSFDIIGPMHRAHLRVDERGSSAALPASSAGLRLAAMPTAEPAPLLQVVASCGFFDLSCTFLKGLAKHLGLELDSGASLVSVIVALAQSIVPKISESRLSALLTARMVRMESPDLHQLMKLDIVADAFDKQEVEQVHKEQTDF